MIFVNLNKLGNVSVVEMHIPPEQKSLLAQLTCVRNRNTVSKYGRRKYLPVEMGRQPKQARSNN